MFSRLFALFVVVPLIELALLIQVGQWIGLLPTVGIVLLTGAAGAALARREGLRTVQRIQGELASGRVPGDALLDGAAILVGGAFLLTPGVLTDVVGLSLLLPPTRALLKGRVRSWFERRLRDGSMNVHVVGFGPAGFGGGFGSGDGGASVGNASSPDGGSVDTQDEPRVELGGPGTERG